jgi:hypothetical protein
MFAHTQANRNGHFFTPHQLESESCTRNSQLLAAHHATLDHFARFAFAHAMIHQFGTATPFV